MSCKQLVELVTDYLEGRLPEAQTRELEAHLALCDGCTAYIEQMRVTLEALGRDPGGDRLDGRARSADRGLPGNAAERRLAVCRYFSLRTLNSPAWSESKRPWDCFRPVTPESTSFTDFFDSLVMMWSTLWSNAEVGPLKMLGTQHPSGFDVERSVNPLSSITW